MPKVIFILLISGLLISNSSLAQPNCQTKSGYLASVSEDLFDKAVGFAVQKDYVALQKLIDARLVFSLRAGVSVYLEDTKLFSGKAKIRPQGSTSSVWTNIEAVSCK